MPNLLTMLNILTIIKVIAFRAEDCRSKQDTCLGNMARAVSFNRGWTVYVVQFDSLFVFLSSGGASIFHYSEEMQNVLAFGSQLLFLYVMESEVWLVAVFFNFHYLAMRFGS